jgi:hypothetical protein
MSGMCGLACVNVPRDCQSRAIGFAFQRQRALCAQLPLKRLEVRNPGRRREEN